MSFKAAFVQPTLKEIMDYFSQGKLNDQDDINQDAFVCNYSNQNLENKKSFEFNPAFLYIPELEREPFYYKVGVDFMTNQPKYRRHGDLVAVIKEIARHEK